MWNLNPDLDIWAVYFMGAYGLGMMAWWATHSEQRAQRMLWVALIAALTLAALGMEWRDRIALAGGSALLLAIGGNVHWREAVRTWQLPTPGVDGPALVLHLLDPLPHVFAGECRSPHPLADSMAANSLGMVAAVLLSISAGAVLYEWTERSTATWQRLRHWHVGVLSTGLMATLLQWM